MKKLFALLLALVMLFALTACAGNEGNEPTEAPTDAGPTEGPTQGPTEPPTDPADDLTSVLEGVAISPAMCSRDEFVSRLKELLDGLVPDKKNHYTEGFDPEQENGWQNTYYIHNFAEDHELNLFLHETNYAEGKEASGWIVVDEFVYEYIDKSNHSVSMFYSIPCEDLEAVIAYAKKDLGCLAGIYGFVPTDMKFTVTIKNKKTEIKLSESDFAKLASGEYTVINGVFSSAPACGDACKAEIDIKKAADGTLEYVFRARIQLDA